jgi:hypothetical protein
MKNSLEHPILWQKRNEWQIEDDAQTDWQQMQGLLDMHMPVTGGISGGGAAGSGGSSWLGITGIKLASAIIAALLAAAAVIYVVAHRNNADKTTTPLKYQTEKSTQTDNHTIESLDSAGHNNNTATQRNAPVTTDANNKASTAPLVNAAADKRSGTATTANGNNKAGTTLAGKVNKNNSASLSGNSQGSINVGANKNGNEISASNKSSAVSEANKRKRTDLNHHLPVGSKTGISITGNSNVLDKNANTKSAKAGTNSNVEHALVASNSSALSKRNESHNGNLNTVAYRGSIAAHTATNLSGITAYGSVSKGGRGRRLNDKSTNYLIGRSAKAPGGNNIDNRLAGSGDPSGSNNNNVPEQVNNLTNSKNNSSTPANIDIPRYYGIPMAVVVPRFTADNNVTIVTKLNTGKPAQIIAPVPLPGKAQKVKNNQPAKLEIGILAGVNTSGSFTPKSQNNNFYGSLPVDAFLGVFVNYTVHVNWALNIQPKLWSAQSVSGTYSHANESKIDSGQTLVISDSRKMYFVDVPIHVMYRATPNLSFMAGPAVSFPVKAINSITTFSPGKAQKDSAYYVKVRTTLAATTYSTRPNFGFSTGVSYNYKRLFFNASYLKALKTQTVSSDLGSYSYNHDALQLSVGFKLK